MQDKTGRDCEDQIRVCVCEGRARELCEGERLTSEQDPAEEAVIPVQGVAVPAVLAELVLALHRPLSHAQAMARITSGCRWHSCRWWLTRPGTLSHITLEEPLVALMYLGRTSVGESPEQQGLAGCFPRVGKVQNSISYMNSLSCRGY